MVLKFGTVQNSEQKVLSAEMSESENREDEIKLKDDLNVSIFILVNLLCAFCACLFVIWAIIKVTLCKNCKSE